MPVWVYDATQRPCICHLSMQHACASAEGPRTTSGAVQSNRTYGASATPLGPVWVYARYPTTMHMSSVDAACVCECGGPTHDERRRAIESHVWCLSDAAGACVGACALLTEPVYTICQCSMKAVQSDAATRLLHQLYALLTQHQHQTHAEMPSPAQLPPQPHQPPQDVAGHVVRLCRVTHAPSRAPKAVNKIANQ
jgi:hypothetical protein